MMTVNFNKNSEESNMLEFGSRIYWINILTIQQGPGDLLMICQQSILIDLCTLSFEQDFR